MTVPTLLLQARSAGSTGAWIDITAWLRIDSPVTVTRGREREESTASASTCSLTLDNAGGQFTEGRTSTIGGQSLTWSRWAQLRLSINGQLRFTGWLTNLGLGWPGAVINAARVTVTASGVKAAMAVSPNLSSWITEMVEDLSPAAWWPLDDPVESVVGRQVVSGQSPLETGVVRVASTEPGFRFGGASPTWFDGGGSLLELTPKAKVNDTETGWDEASVAFPVAPLASITRPFTLLFVHQPNFAADNFGRAPIISVRGPLFTTVVLWRVGGALSLYYSPGSGGGSSARVSVGTVDDGVPRLMGIAFTASSTRLLGRPQTVSAIGDPTTIGLCDLRNMSIDISGMPLSNVVIPSGLYGSVAIVSGAMSDNDFADLRRRVEGGLGTDLEWLERACEYAGTAAPSKLGPTRQILRPRMRGSNPASIGDEMAAAYGGMLTDGRDGTPTLVDPRYVPTQAIVPVIHLDAVDGDALRWSSDPTLRVTEAGQGEGIMASRSSWPRARVDIDPGVPTTAAQARADWLVNASDVAEAARLTGIRLDLLAWPWTSDRVNLALNPSFEAVSAAVEVRRNVHPTPRATAGWTFAWGAGGSGTATLESDARFVGDAARKGVWSAGGSGAYLEPGINATEKMAIGEVWLLSMRVQQTGFAAPGYVRAGGSNNPICTYIDGSIDNGDGTITRYAIATCTGLGTGDGTFRAYISLGVASTGAVILASNLMAVKSPVVSPYFDHGHSPDSDLTPSPLGAANNSASILTASTISSTSGTNVDMASISSQQWAKIGGRSLRIVPRSAANTTYTHVAGANNALTGFGITFEAGKTYTVLATCRLTAPQTGTLWSTSRAIRVQYGTGSLLPAQSVSAPNAAGIYNMRHTFTLPAGTDRCVVWLTNGASAGNGDIWWDNLLIVEGAYGGPWFEGVLPSISTLQQLAYLHRPRVRIDADLPSQLPEPLRTMTVEGTTETVSVSEWTLELSTAPDPRLILGDPMQGVLGTPASNRLGF